MACYGSDLRALWCGTVLVAIGATGCPGTSSGPPDATRGEVGSPPATATTSQAAAASAVATSSATMAPDASAAAAPNPPLPVRLESDKLILAWAITLPQDPAPGALSLEQVETTLTSLHDAWVRCDVEGPKSYGPHMVGYGRFDFTFTVRADGQTTGITGGGLDSEVPREQRLAPPKCKCILDAVDAKVFPRSQAARQVVVSLGMKPR